MIARYYEISTYQLEEKLAYFPSCLISEDIQLVKIFHRESWSQNSSFTLNNYQESQFNENKNKENNCSKKDSIRLI